MKNFLIKFKPLIILILVLITAMTSFLPLYSFYAADLFENQEYDNGSLVYDSRLAGKVNVSLISFVSSLVDEDVKTVMEIKKYEEKIEYYASEIARKAHEYGSNYKIEESQDYQEHEKLCEEYAEYMATLSHEDKNRIAEKLETPEFAKKLSVRFVHSKMLFSNKTVWDEQTNTNSEFSPLYLESIPAKIVMARFFWHLVLYGIYIIIAISATVLIVTGILDLIKYFKKKKESLDFEYDDETFDPSFLFLLQGLLVLLLKTFFIHFSFGYGTILTMVFFGIYCIAKAVCTGVSLPNKASRTAFIKKQVVNIICIIICLCSLISLSSIGIGREIRTNSESYEVKYTYSYMEKHLPSVIQSVSDRNPSWSIEQINENAYRTCISQMNKEYNKSHLLFETACAVAPFISLFLIAFIAVRAAGIKRKNEKNEIKSDNYGLLAVVLILLSCVPFLMKADTVRDQSKDFESGKLSIVLDDHTDENSADYLQYKLAQENIDFYEDLLNNHSSDEENPNETEIIENELARYKKQKAAIGANQTVLIIVSIASAALLLILELVYPSMDKKYRYAKILGETNKETEEKESANT